MSSRRRYSIPQAPLCQGGRSPTSIERKHQSRSLSEIYHFLASGGEQALPWGIRAITTDASGKFCFVSYSQRVDILEIGETNDGAKLNRKFRLDWSGYPNLLWPGQHNHNKDNYLAEFLACHGDYVIIGESQAQRLRNPR